jgi:apolipoprotein N-acyltransferase
VSAPRAGVGPGRAARLAWAAAFVLATFWAFPQVIAGRVIDLGLAVSWLAPACLLLALRGLAPGRAARLGFLAGLAAHGAVLHWIYVVTVRYGNAPPVVGVVAPLALASYIAAHTCLFAAAWSWLARRGVRSPFVAAALWAAVDHLRSFSLTGFPWATLGYAQHASPLLLGLAAWTGVYGLSFATALGGAGLARIVDRRAPAAGLPALAVVLGLHALGPLAAPEPIGDGPRLRVGVLQGNVDQGVKWSPAFAERTLAGYEALTRRAVEQGARVVVWPETAVPGSLSVHPDLAQRVAALARETGALLVVGSVGIEPSRAGSWREGEVRYYDSAFVIDAEGRVLDRYDKTHLVPYGEYVPLRALLGRFLSAVASGMTSGDVSPGEAPRAIALEPPGGGALSAGIPICYELLFPDLVRRFVAGGAQLLLAITNDAWYGRTGAPYQFLAITALRSAETGVWTARAANTGVSAFIDERGRVRERTPIFETGLLVADVPLRSPEAPRTYYVRHGDVFAWTSWAAVAGAAVLAGRRPSRAVGGA